MDSIFYGIQNILKVEEVQTFFKLILIIILAGLLGYDREYWKKPAGFRTYVLAGISAVLVMVCGIQLHQNTGSDVSRIPAQLLSGIGFLGAGTILRDGSNVKGLTTAAGLLAITCIGLVVGAGFYISAIIATFFVYIIFRYSHVLSSTLDHYNVLDLEIVTKKPKLVLEDLKEILSEYDVEIVKMKVIDDEESIDSIKIATKYKEDFQINDLITKIMSIPTVKEVFEVKDL